MRKDKRKSREPKGIYRVRNWSEYNAGLIARGSLTMWIDESAFVSGSDARAVKRGQTAGLLGRNDSGRANA
jgi:hypothetical protein